MEERNEPRYGWPMTDQEIKRSYRNAKSKAAQIGILADLCVVPKNIIRAKMADLGIPQMGHAPRVDAEDAAFYGLSQSHVYDVNQNYANTSQDDEPDLPTVETVLAQAGTEQVNTTTNEMEDDSMADNTEQDALENAVEVAETASEASEPTDPNEMRCKRCGRTKKVYYMTGAYCDTCSLQVAAQLSKDLLFVYEMLGEDDLRHIQEHYHRLYLPGL